MSLFLRPLCASLILVMVGSCPLTTDEQGIANEVQTRRDRVSSGHIASQIASGSYTIDSLSDDMYRWWVQDGLAAQNAAIENFVNLMQQAKQNAQKSDWLSVILGWLDLMLGAIGDEVAVLAEANSALENALNTWQTAAQNTDGDFLTAAEQFRAQLPTKLTTQLTAVDDFINGLRNIPADQRDTGLLAAYSQVTDIIATTSSYRSAFNQHYVSFLKGAGLDSHFYYSWNAGNSAGRNAVWRLTPNGLDACTVANFVHDLNVGCVSTKTPGFEKLTQSVEVTVNQGPAVGLELSCDDLELSHYTGCWIQGLWRNDGNCYTVYQQARVIDSYWPPSQVTDFCKNVISSSSTYAACNPIGFDGVANCQKDPNLYSCESVTV